MKKKRVLIADDDVDFLKALSFRVRELGCHVLEAQNGFQAACELLLSGDQSFHPDIVILDIQMPEIDGLAICEDMMMEGVLQSIPTIVLTGRSDSGTMRRVKELGCFYIKKSTDYWLNLKAVLEKLLERSDLPLEKNSPNHQDSILSSADPEMFDFAN